MYFQPTPVAYDDGIRQIHRPENRWRRLRNRADLNQPLVKPEVALGPRGTRREEARQRQREQSDQTGAAAGPSGVNNTYPSAESGNELPQEVPRLRHEPRPRRPRRRQDSRRDPLPPLYPTRREAQSLHRNRSRAPPKEPQKTSSALSPENAGVLKFDTHGFERE